MAVTTTPTNPPMDPQHLRDLAAVNEYMLNLPPEKREAFARTVIDIAAVQDIQAKART